MNDLKIQYQKKKKSTYTIHIDHNNDIVLKRTFNKFTIQ